MSFAGADVEELRALAVRFDRQAARLREIAGSSSAAIMTAQWTGAKIDDVRAEWNRTAKPKVLAVAAAFSGLATDLRRDADEQSTASGGPSGSAPLIGDYRGPQGPMWPGGGAGLPDWGRAFPQFIDDVIGAGEGISSRVDWANEAVKYLTGKEFDAWDVVPGGSYASSVLKGIGLGDAAARLALAAQGGDLAGGMLAVVDGAATFAPGPVSLLYGGLKDQISFYIPLDQASEAEHMEWMESRGYSDQQIAERYTGLQGFIDLGNDNVERKAPWLNRAADAALGGVGEWLYNAGIKLI